MIPLFVVVTKTLKNAVRPDTPQMRLQWLRMGCPPPVDLSSSQQPQHVMRVLQWCAVLSRPSILLDSLSCRREQLQNQFVGRAVRWQHPCPSSRFRTIDRRATGLDRA